jgi:methylase of polypeptide subunit release factors
VAGRTPRAGAPPALAALAELFLLGRPIACGRLEGALGTAVTASLLDGGLLAPQGARLTPLVRITPFAGLLFTHDPEHGELAPDHVGGIGPAARTLAALTIRRPVRSVLDVGTGCGVQALLAAPHAEHVVGVDINPRATAFARVNAALNGVENVEFREGDLFEPVSGERFDLAVCNPPFVISPESTLVFRDGTATGVNCERVVAGLAHVLADGGHAQVLLNWVVSGDDVDAEPRRWVEGAGCDAWLLRHQLEAAPSYAAKWNGHLLAQGREPYEAEIARWLDHYERAGIERIASGALVLRRRRGGDPWWRADDVALGAPGSASEAVLRVFAGEDLLRSLHDDAALLALAPRVAAHHRLTQTLTHHGQGYEVTDSRLVAEDGVVLSVPAPPNALHVLFTLDARRTLGELVQEAVEETGIEREALLPDVIRTVRGALALGFLAA